MAEACRVKSRKTRSRSGFTSTSSDRARPWPTIARAKHDYLGALDLLRQASELAPDNASAGDVATALCHAREMAALHPADPQFRKLVSDLEKRQGH